MKYLGILFLVSLLATPAFAASGGSSGGASGEQATLCPKPKVYDTKTHTCVCPPDAKNCKP